MAAPPPDGGGVATSHPPVRAAGWKKKEGERLRSWSADGIVYIGVGASAWLLEQLSLLSAFPFRAVALALAGAGIGCLLRHRRCLWALTWRTVEQGGTAQRLALLWAGRSALQPRRGHRVGPSPGPAQSGAAPLPCLPVCLDGAAGEGRLAACGPALAGCVLGRLHQPAV